MNLNKLSNSLGVVDDLELENVVPKSIWDKISEFTSTWIGGIVVTVVFIAIVIVLALFLVRIINHAFKKAVDRMLAEKNPAATAFAYLRYLALAGIYFAAIAIIVSNIPWLASGMNKLFAAGGVLAVVVGLASQQAMGSMVSGAMILAFKPFVIGDVINVVSNNVMGTVEEITLRHTIIRTVENKRVIIPNDAMNSAIIENANYAETKVCLMLDIGITYESDISHAMQIMREEIINHPTYYDNRTEEDIKNGAPAVVVRVQELADSAVIIRAQLWAKDNATAFPMRSDLLKSIKERCESEGVDIAYPHIVIMNKIS